MLKKSNNIYLTNDGSYTLYNSLVKEHYHSTHGAVQESKHVFIANGIAPLFKRKPMPKMINILEVGFGTGLNALLSIDISELHEVKLNYTSLEPYPLCQNEIKQLNYFNFFDEVDLRKAQFKLIHECDMGITCSINSLFNLTKHEIKIQEFNTQDQSLDIVYFDAFSPEKQPEMWNFDILLKLYLFLKKDGLFVTYCAKGELKRNLKKAGFLVETLPGPPGKREMILAKKLI